METGNAISIYPNPTLSLSIALRKQLEQIRQVQINMVNQYNEAVSLAFKFPFTKLVEDIKEMQMSMARSLQLTLNPFAPAYEPVVSIQEAEIVEDDSSLFDLTVSIEGRFYFQDKLISTISTNSKHGKLLKMLLVHDDNYLTDEEISKKLGVSKDRGIGYLRRDMKRSLKEFGLETDLYRVKEEGYRLLGVKKLLN